MSRLQCTYTATALFAVASAPALAHHEATIALPGGALLFGGAIMASLTWLCLRRLWG
tara:strand:- start:48244 stop:48414 length:171 start_codon:yes stop_codon:yes gene_type:complete